jgi:hypothetical protein
MEVYTPTLQPIVRNHKLMGCSLLHAVKQKDAQRPNDHQYGSTGPTEADELKTRVGLVVLKLACITYIGLPLGPITRTKL